MAAERSRSAASVRNIEPFIFLVRGERVVLDTTIASLYGVSVKQLKQAVRRNRKRFPSDFLFDLNWKETISLRSQTVTLDAGTPVGTGPRRHSPGRGSHSKYRFFAFTEQGVAMLSSVLRTERAIGVNVEIMRAFVRLRRILGSYGELAWRIDDLEKKYDTKFKVVFDALRAMMQTPADSERRLIGFRSGRTEEGRGSRRGTSRRGRGAADPLAR